MSCVKRRSTITTPNQVSTNRPSHRERDDNYQHVVLTFSDKWRLIVGAVEGAKNGTQWILQYRASRNHWTGRSYFSRARHVPDRVKALGEAAYGMARDWAAQSHRTFV